MCQDGLGTEQKRVINRKKPIFLKLALLIIPDMTAKSKSGDENISIFQVSGEFFPRSGEKVGKKAPIPLVYFTAIP